MTEIALVDKRGIVRGHAVIDDADLSLVSGRTWRLTSHGYARCADGTKRIYMHRILFPADEIAGKEIDHINGNTLDNRRANLRVVGHSVNGANRQGLHARNKSGYRGVYRGPRGWVANVAVGGKTRSLGTYKTPEMASDVVQAELARLGVPTARQVA